jgi:hypothetical protein
MQRGSQIGPGVSHPLRHKLPVRPQLNAFSVYDLRFLQLCLWRMPSSGIGKHSSYFTGDTLHFRYRADVINIMQNLSFQRRWLWRMPSSGMWRHVALVRTNVSEERIAFIIRMTRIGELGTTLAITRKFLRNVLRLLVTDNVVPSSPILVTLMMKAIGSSETSVLTWATWRHISEDGILHSHCRGNLKSYIALTGWTL